MRRQERHVWLLVLILCSGFSIACASNPTNTQETSTVPNSERSTTVAESSGDAAAAAYATSGDSEQELERSLQEFDEKILRELEETQQQRQENARQKAALRSDSELEAEGESEGEGESESQQSAEGEGNEGSEGGKETASTSGQQTSGGSDEAPAGQETANTTEQKESGTQEREGSASTQTATIPTGDDDDVIARQLREAAEAETDPEVKEKLWEEYRKYKNQQDSSTATAQP